MIAYFCETMYNNKAPSQLFPLFLRAAAPIITGGGLRFVLAFPCRMWYDEVTGRCCIRYSPFHGEEACLKEGGPFILHIYSWHGMMDTASCLKIHAARGAPLSGSQRRSSCLFSRGLRAKKIHADFLWRSVASFALHTNFLQKIGRTVDSVSGSRFDGFPF